MRYALTFHPSALIEYRSASIWYEERQDGLGLKYEAAVENKLEQVLKNPLAFSKNKRSYRQAVIDVFPFVIVYQINERTGVIYISSIYHTRKNPRGKYRKPNDSQLGS